MFDRVELIKAFNSTLELMFDEFCQARSRLAIYEKMRKISLLVQFSVERYIVSLIISLASRSHHQVVLIIKSFSSSSRFIIKSFSSSSRFHHQVVVIIKSIYQVNLSSQPIKSPYQATLPSHPTKSLYQVNLPSHLIKPLYQAVASTQKRS
jgi:hypothetical protein